MYFLPRRAKHNHPGLNPAHIRESRVVYRNRFLIFYHAALIIVIVLNKLFCTYGAKKRWLLINSTDMLFLRDIMYHVSAACPIGT